MLAEKGLLITPEEYLKGELVSDVKHEYVGGYVYAMAGAKNRHNDVALNVLAALHAQLRGKPCRPYNSDTKVRIQLREELRFYYPDAQVTCEPNGAEDTFQDRPSVLVEVLSEGTRRTDEREKLDAYLTIPSLTVYLLIETDTALIVGHRRTPNGFVREVYEGRNAVIDLPAIGARLALADAYEGIELEA